MADVIAPGLAVPADRPRMSAWQQAALSLYWFATNAHWTAILITLLPLQAELIGGAEFKGTTLGQILAIGAFASMVVAPLFGAWSDRVRTRWGRRKPFLVVGTLGNVLGLLALAFIPSAPSALVPYIMAFIWIELFNNLATAPYSGLIPDMVLAEQRGSASGWMGLMLMIGNFLGGITGLVLALIGGITGAYILIAAIMILGMLGTVLTVHEPEPPSVPPFHWGAFARGLIEPFKSHDFSWVFWTRFLVTLGTFTVQSFLLFYMKDVIAGGAEHFDYTFFGIKLAGDAAGATSFFVLPLLLGAILSSLVAGMLSDRYGRKLMVYISGALQAAVVLVFLFAGGFEVAVIMGFVFGLGYGAYQAVDWALASDVLPSEDDYAKDMGVWHVSFTLPQVLAVPIGGVLLDTFQRIGRDTGRPNLGYTVLFVLAFVYFVLGTVLVRQVKGAR
ncbi:MAG: MFS transporter [Kouleothrix sp.]|jgi:MFS family permease|nr:MFS transporter [Kouleothrix sp.]